jgi:membrane protease YdiL (CAAX protease family)
MLKQWMRPRAIYSGEPAKGWLPWGILAPFIGIAFVIVSVGVLQIALQQLHLLDANENPVGLAGFATFLLLPFGALGLIVLAWVRFVERRPLDAIGLGGTRRVWIFVRGHLTGVAMASAIVAGIWLTNSFAAGAFGRAFLSPAAMAGIALLLVCFAVQSSVEELLFRGWMLSVMSSRMGVVVAVAISSATFTLLHYDPGAAWVFVGNVFLFGVFACCWSLRTGNIWSVMGWHAGWNWILATGFELRVTGLDAHEPALLVKLIPKGPDMFTGGAEGPEGSLLCTLVLATAIGVLAWRRGHASRAQ